MTEILDKFISVWFYWMFVSFGLGIIGFIILLIRKFSNDENKNRYLKIGVILFAQTFLTWMIEFGGLWIIQNQAKKELKEFLNQSDLIVSIDNMKIDQEQSTIIISELKSIKKVEAHHSHPTIKIKIIIKSKTDKIRLSIEQDSEFKNEYWIFWDKYKTTESNEIGRIKTDIFNKNNVGTIE